MKKSIVTGLAVMLIGSFAACKGNNEANDMDNTEMTTDGTASDMDSMETEDAMIVNDTNAAGTTSGEMEQVP